MKTLTVNEFLKKNERKKFNSIEQLVSKINKDSKLKSMLVVITGNLLYAKDVLAANSNVDAKVNEVGNTLLSITRSFGYWICLGMCALEIIKSILQSNTSNISKIIVKYILGFSALYFLPWIFDLIREVFI